MDINDPRWEEYDARFREVAEKAEEVEGPQSSAASAQYILFLYGENGLTPEEEFEMLARLEEAGCENRLKKFEVDTTIWQDTVLYVP